MNETNIEQEPIMYYLRYIAGLTFLVFSISSLSLNLLLIIILIKV